MDSRFIFWHGRMVIPERSFDKVLGSYNVCDKGRQDYSLTFTYGQTND